jgi:UDP-N-acetylmuramoyl-tripeptide--D-alanyl-D-alanine ligase
VVEALMEHMTLGEIAAACGGIYAGQDEKKDQSILGAVTDSREIKEGYLFIPIKGEHVDGHDFIPKVFEQGALATLTEHPLESCQGPYILVKSCLLALKQIAAYYRSCLSIPIVGITGSVGKTSTKEMIASVLSVKYNVLKTLGNFNNEIGLPLTILRIQKEHEVAVVEMGISEFGEMHRLGEIAKPDLCVITNIGTCHLENLGNRDGVLRAKTEVFDHISEGAAVFLNGDDDKLITVTQAGKSIPVFYGMEGQDFFMDQVENLGLRGSRARLHTPQGATEVMIPIPGSHNLYNAMAAAGVGLRLGLSLEEVAEGIANARTIQGRSNIIEANGLVIIDDCYNANPMSMKASLNVLKCGLGRTIAVLGDMGELGEQEGHHHYDVGAYAVQNGIDVLFCVGELSKEMERGAREAGGDTQIFYYQGREEMLSHLMDTVCKGDTILVKASHFMKFSKVVEQLLNT